MRAKVGAEKLLWYITSNKVPPHIANPPGYIPVSANVQMLRGAEHPMSAFWKRASVESAIEAERSCTRSRPGLSCSPSLGGAGGTVVGEAGSIAGLTACPAPGTS